MVPDMTPRPEVDAANDARSAPAVVPDRPRFEVHRLRAAFATAALPPLPPATLGDVTLAPHQRDAAARLSAILARHRGALLADDVGLGKTYVALAVARDYEHVHVIAPAALLAMWTAALVRSATPHGQLHSLHAFSRGSAPSLATRARTLVIIDEAHHLRNNGTRRYTNVVQAIAGADVLLLTATPLHNRTDDLRTLLGLFAGNRPDLLTEAQRAALIVRRTAPDVPLGMRPTVRTHRPHRLPLDSGTLTRIMSLPAPLPAQDGAAAGALIRMGLLRAWCSSDAALRHAVRRRRLRGAALRDALLAGRHPTQQELRTWAVGDTEGQLAFPELLASQSVEQGPLLAVLERHLDALAELERHVEGQRELDPLRARLLRRVLERHGDVPVVAFSQYTRTVQAMYRALGDIAGVAALTGARAQIASGPIPRLEALRLFAPRAHERPHPPVRERLRLLLTTDLLAEGVNLQDAGVVVHLDLPWTAALRDQRVGRCVRIGSPHATVHVHRLAPSARIERQLQLEARVLRKAARARRAVGAASEASRRVRGSAPISAPERATRVHALLQEWRAAVPSGMDVRRLAPPPAHGSTHWALAATGRGALAVVALEGRTRLLAVVCQGERHVVTARIGVVEQLLRRAHAATQVISAPDALVNGVRRALRRWLRRTAARDLAGMAPTALSPRQRRAFETLEGVAQSLPLARRSRESGRIDAARRVISAARGPAAERALAEWGRSASASSAWVQEWQRFPALALSSPPAAEAPGEAPRARTVRLLLLDGD
jgi:superfamily II DNA or RNA helicase